MQFTPPQYHSLQWAARYRGIRKTLRRSAIGLGILTLFCILGGLGALFGENEPEIATVVFVIGGIFLTQTLLNLFLPRPWVLISQGILILLFVSLYVVGICGLLASGGGFGAPGIIWFLIMLAWGIGSIRRYNEYRDVPSNAPPQDLLTWVDATAKTLRKTKPEMDSSVIEFKMQHQFALSVVNWRGRLAPDSITLTDKPGVEFLILDRGGINIIPGKPTLFRKNIFKATIMLNNQRYKGTIGQTSLERFGMWMQSASIQGGPMVQGGPLWVPRA